jgi:hypothetical protein
MYQIARIVIGYIQERRLHNSCDDVGGKKAPFEN